MGKYTVWLPGLRLQYTVRVSNVSLKASERDIYDFFAFSGEISSIQTKPCGEEAPGTQEAYVTFQEERSLETALLLTGAVVADKPVTVELAPDYEVPAESAARSYAGGAAAGQGGSGDALKKAEGMIASLLAQGYIVGKDAMEKARALDQQHALSAQAKVHAETLQRGAADLDSKYSISKKFSETTASMSKSFSTVDEKYHVTSKTKEALSAAEHSLSEAGQYVMQNKYVSSSSAWLMGALGQLKTIVADVQQQAAEKVTKAEEERGGHQGATGQPGGAQGGGEAPAGLADRGPSIAHDTPAPGLAHPTSLMDEPLGNSSPATQREPPPPAAAKSSFASADPPLF